MTGQEVRNLLGPGVVLLGWPLGSKGTRTKWGHLTAADMTPAYLRKLERGNIGVALGEVSDNLIVVDVDIDTLVLPYLSVNPAWNGTLQTHGARGCAFWLRMAGDYPARTVKLKTHSGEDAGEFRSNGSQSIIHGIHPDGNQYQMVNRAKPLVVNFQSFNWPAEIANPPSLSECLPVNGVDQSAGATRLPLCDTERQSAGVTDAILESVSPSLRLSVSSVDEAVQLALPGKAHENNDRLFTLARAVKSLELQSAKFTPAQLRDVFSRWHKLAAEFLRPDQSKDEYLTQFMNAYASAKFPLGEGRVTQAWKAAHEKPLPPEAVEAFEDEALRRVVALCRELQIIAGKAPFYLSARTLQNLLKQDGHATAARWLRSLCVLQILEEVEKGNGNRASRYHYKGSIT